MKKYISVLVLALSFMTIAHGQTLSVEDVQMEKSTRKQVAIGLNNSSKDQSGIQFDLVLPEGISAAVDEATLNPNRVADHELHVKQVDEKTYRFLAFSRNNASFIGTRGDLVYVTLVSSDKVSANVMAASIRTTLLYASDNSITDLANVSFNVQIINEQINQSPAMLITANGVRFKMIRVDGGTFTMGATSEQGDDAHGNEKPTHQVTLSSYYIGETEVTQELWQAVMGSNPSYFSGSQKPVEQVSWIDCQEFVRKLNSLTGQNFRLPTEAEWEYAARGGNRSRGYKYAGSNTIGNVAWYRYNIPSTSSGTAGYSTQNVATKQANELGLYDMSGNVLEWCQDWYHKYSSSSQTNPTGPSNPPGEDPKRVLRGGSWADFAGACRVSYRDRDFGGGRYKIYGLRLAL